MDEALIALRLVQFASATLAFGVTAFQLYAVAGPEPAALSALDLRLRWLLLVSATAALLSALALVPLIGGMMAGSIAAGFDLATITTVLSNTSFGRVWSWHLLIAALLVVAGAVRRVRPAYRSVLAALVLASLGWVGHAVIGEGPVGLVHEINDSVHLLAGGVWLGGLLPLALLAVRARRSRGGVWLCVLRDALPRFSRIGYAAVALIALTGVVNTAILVGSIDGLTGTPYGRLLLVKMALFLLMVAVAIVNRFILTPLIGREVMPLPGTAALMWTVGVEQILGFGILIAVSVLGTWPPAMHMQHH